MKTKIEVQFQERNVDVKDTEKLVKENLKAAGVTLQQQKTAKRSVTKKH